MLTLLMRCLSTGERHCRWLVWALAGTVLLYVACVAAFGTGPINVDCNDALVLLDGAWRIVNGQIPHRDFYLALGPLEFLIGAGGMWLTHFTPKGLSVGIAIAGACVGIWAWGIARQRMPPVTASLVASWATLMATCPAALDSTPNAVGCDMIYNRLGYALLGIVLVECAFVDVHGRFWGGVSSGAILVLLLFLKLNFFGAAVLLLLVTVPIRRQEVRRLWGILAGATAVLASFSVYLRFALRAFIADMWLATQARSRSLSLRETAGVIPGSGSVATLLILTVLTVLLVSPGRFRHSQGVRTILLACMTIAVSGLLRSTDALEIGLHLLALWGVILVAQLAAAYPEAREKAAVAVLAAVGLGGIAATFYTDGLAMRALLKYRLTPRWSAGTSIAGYRMEGLRFFDDPDIYAMYSDNGHRYAIYVSDGVQLLESLSSPTEKVGTVGFHNPFSYVLRRKPATGGSPFLLLGNNVQLAHLPDPQRMFGNADLIMEPHSHHSSDQQLEDAYRPYLLQHYSLAGQSQWWTLYRRNR